MSPNKHEDFFSLQMDNDLNVDFEGLVGMLKSLLQDCVQYPAIYQSTFTMENDEGIAFWRFNHISEYRKSQIVQLNFKQPDDDEINEHISYRVNSNERKAEMIAERIRDINEIIRKACEVAATEQKLDFDANVLLM